MAIDTIKSSAVLDGAIATADIADDAVTNAKIGSGAVGATEVASNAVTTAKIASGAVTSAKLDTNIAVAGDLTVDTNVLKVDSTNNKVGINVTSPDAMLQVQNGDITVGWADNFIGTQFQTGSDFRLGMKFATVARTLKLVAETNDNNGEITFETNGSERARVTNNGITFNGDTAAANALDDYEEGTWTPFYTSQHGNLTLNGNASNTSSMYTSQGGSYIKIGKKVICHMTLATTGVTSFGGSGNLWVAGLPFANATTTASKPRGVNGCMAGRFNSFTPDQLVCNSNATTMQIRAGFESYPDINKLDVGGSGNRNVIEALIVFEIA